MNLIKEVKDTEGRNWKRQKSVGGKGFHVHASVGSIIVKMVMSLKSIVRFHAALVKNHNGIVAELKETILEFVLKPERPTGEETGLGNRESQGVYQYLIGVRNVLSQPN